jgi:hypothetical protein
VRGIILRHAGLRSMLLAHRLHGLRASLAASIDEIDAAVSDDTAQG